MELNALGSAGKRTQRHTSPVAFALFASVAAAFTIPAMASVRLTLSPEFATTRIGNTHQFTATLTGTTAPLTWQVNGITGGNSTVGTISPTGLFTAPAKEPPGTTVTITVSAAGAEPQTAVDAVTSGLSFYVSTTGSDTNAGTSAAPWKTIQHAANEAIAGDTVFVFGGTYHESVNLPHSGSGAAGSIVFRSYPGETAIVDGTGVTCCSDSIQGLFNITGD